MKRSAVLVFFLFLVACTSTKPVDMKEARRVVGTESDVRVDAEVYGDRLGPNITLPVKYDVTNHRKTTILIADLLPARQCERVAGRCRHFILMREAVHTCVHPA